MFLSNKFNKNSILQYNDYIDTKLTTNNKNMIIEQDYKENRVGELNRKHKSFDILFLRNYINVY
jgi:hypothetical protein